MISMASQTFNCRRREESIGIRAVPLVSSATRSNALLTALTLSVMFLISACWRPSDDGLALCPFRILTGYPCPGCGMTRAFCHLGHGEPQAAFTMNALSPVLYLGALLILLHAVAKLLKLERMRRALEILRLSTNGAWLMLVVFLAWWVVRLRYGL